MNSVMSRSYVMGEFLIVTRLSLVAKVKSSKVPKLKLSLCTQFNLHIKLYTLFILFDLISVMLNDNPMIEGTSGEVHITDFTADVIENLLSFMYNDIVDKKNINCDLLKAANKYLMEGLKNICSAHLSANLTLENALEVMIVAYLTDQKDLLDSAFKFSLLNKGRLIKTDSWEEMVKNYPDLIGKAFSQSMLQTSDVRWCTKKPEEI